MKDKLKVLASLILAVLLIVLVIVKGIDRRSDSEKFVNEYERLNGKDYVEVKMPKVKNIEYVSFSEIEDMIGGKTSGAIILASSKDNASRKMVPIFIDAAKGQYLKYLDEALRLSKRGTIIIADNVLLRGMVLSDYNEHKHRTAVTRLREYINRVTTDERLKSTIVDIGDGLAISVVQ